MRQYLSYGGLLSIAVLTTTCSGFDRAVVANAFEQRVPIYKCPSQIPVRDSDPLQVFGFNMDKETSLDLLTPQVMLGSRHLKTKDDSIYFDRMRVLIASRIENKFLGEKWSGELIPYSMPQTVDSETGRNVLWDEMTNKVRNKVGVDYNLWSVGKQILNTDKPGYTAMVLINGQIGYDRDNQNMNEVYFYIMDNEAKKVAYADYLAYTCDIRNTDALDRVLNYTFLKFMAARYPEFVEKTETPQ
ncbi:hypothetical protein [Roseivirga pacifica]|uniref:hypothetical protein n=1 Tax=Roseivirga pacifica TaxID=1267423 RepID=UPI00227A2213|nr:hypothetical protein [Roseivirga pacifica]